MIDKEGEEMREEQPHWNCHNIADSYLPGIELQLQELVTPLIHVTVYR